MCDIDYQWQLVRTAREFPGADFDTVIEIADKRALRDEQQRGRGNEQYKPITWAYTCYKTFGIPAATVKQRRYYRINSIG